MFKNYVNALRLIGVAMLLIGFFSWLKNENYLSIFLSLVLALVFLLSPSNYLKKHFNNLSVSFKEWKSVLFVWIIDLAFALSLFLLFLFLSPLYSGVSDAFSQAELESAKGVVDSAVNVKDLVWSGINKLLIYAVVVLVLFFVLYSLSRALMWLILLKKKFDWSFVKSFFVLNFLWWLRCVIVLALFLFILTDPSKVFYVLFILFFLYLHFSTILYHHFAKTSSFSRAFDNYLITGRNIRKFIIPYSQALIILLILSQIYGFIPLTTLNPLLFITLFLAWFRVYMSVELK